jgi:protein-S-isoprenylcysteine O-methyltransferase Ste14
MVNFAETPGVIAPPPVIAVAAIVLGLILDQLLPSNIVASVLTFWLRIVIGTILVLAGGTLAVSAAQRFQAIGTNVPPWKPSLQLATTGIYTRMRNPMYVGTMLLILGIGMWLTSDWILILLIPTGIILHYGVVLREERYLEKTFGDDYLRYKESVSRWGLW